MEVVPTIDALNWIAEEGPEILDEQQIRMGRASSSARRRSSASSRSASSAVIAPWNYPWSIPFGEVAIALMAGNGVVLKPSELTPLLGDRIRVRVREGGDPGRFVRVLQGGGSVGRALAESSVRKVFFTGSVEVGYAVGKACAGVDEGRGARARRQGSGDRLRRRRARQRGRRRSPGPDSPMPGRPARGSSASTSSPTSPSGSSRGIARCDRAARGRRPAELGHRGRADGLGRAGGDRHRPRRRRDLATAPSGSAAAPSRWRARRPATSPRPC